MSLRVPYPPFSMDVVVQRARAPEFDWAVEPRGWVVRTRPALCGGDCAMCVSGWGLRCMVETVQCVCRGGDRVWEGRGCLCGVCVGFGTALYCGDCAMCVSGWGLRCMVETVRCVCRGGWMGVVVAKLLWLSG
jgi:hypothetical protein